MRKMLSRDVPPFPMVKPSGSDFIVVGELGLDNLHCCRVELP